MSFAMQELCDVFDLDPSEVHFDFFEDTEDMYLAGFELEFE